MNDITEDSEHEHSSRAFTQSREGQRQPFRHADAERQALLIEARALVERTRALAQSLRDFESLSAHPLIRATRESAALRARYGRPRFPPDHCADVIAFKPR